MIKVAWLASGFIGRTASGTGQTARKIVEYCVLNLKYEIEITLILKNENEANLVLADPVLSKCKIIILPYVSGKLFKSSRQFYKYCLTTSGDKFDFLHFSVPRVYPFYWLFPSARFVCTFHAAGDITVPTDKFILSRIIYNNIMKHQWNHLDAIYADSDFAVKEIAENYKIPEREITKIYIGANSLWEIDEEELPIDRSRFNVVVIGRWQKYKNIHNVIKVIKNSNDPRIKECNVIVLGKSKSGGYRLVNDSLIGFPKERITLYDYLSEGKMKFLYANADLIIHPSINEGFGIPAFEAFGEGSVVLVHKGTPADQYLSGCGGVLTADMYDNDEIENEIKKSFLIQREIKLLRMKYIFDLGATWENMCQSYIKSYKKLFDVSK